MLPIVQISNKIVLYLYPLMMGIAWGVGYLLINKLNAKFGSPLKKVKIFYLLVFVFSWLGAKLFFVLFSASNSSIALNTNFWLGGGLVFYGGLIFGLLFVTVYFKYKKIHQNVLTIFIPSIAFGHGIGRVGCFMAGCCY